MDPDGRDLINHLYAIATGLINDAEELACRGQSPVVSSTEMQQIGEGIISKINDAEAVTKAAIVLSNDIKSSAEKL